jgi:hypothetical protein
MALFPPRWPGSVTGHPLFVEKVVDVVGLYHHPPERAVALCVDEKARCRAWTGPPGIADALAWIADWNSSPRPFVWTDTAEEILESLAREPQSTAAFRAPQVAERQRRSCVSNKKFTNE